jgi:hypothetical protein
MITGLPWSRWERGGEALGAQFLACPQARYGDSLAPHLVLDPLHEVGVAAILWEGDSLRGKGGKGGIVTFIKREKGRIGTGIGYTCMSLVDTE